MEKAHEAVIRKAMDLMRESLSEPLSIPDLAKKVGYSPSHLRLIFTKATGKGILPHFLEMRISEAKKLLQDTDLTISEIAFEAGFRSYKSFLSSFVKKVGCSPGSFRETQGNTAKPATNLAGEKKAGPDQWHYEPFGGPKLSESFKLVSGTWEQQKGYVSGRDSGTGLLRFCEPLPENFEVRFEACLFRSHGLSSTEFGVILCDANLVPHYEFALGRQDGSLSEFKLQGIPMLLNYQLAPKQEIWHKIKIELEDDIIVLWIDGEEVFRHRDPFPPPFAKRSHIAFSLSNSEIGIREFEVFDRGFLPLVRSVRQGDSLFNGGFHSSARDFYMRLLGSKISTADAMELRYKIGQCFLREEHFLQARGWMEKVIAVPETGFWAENATMSALEMDLREDRLENFERSFLSLWNRANYRQSLRPIFDRACADFQRRGFYEKAYSLRNLLFSAEEENGFSKLFSEADLAEILILIRDFEDSEKHFISVIENPRTPKTARMQLLFSFCNVLGMQGKLDQWSVVLNRLAPLSSSSSFDQGRLAVHRVIFCRAQGKSQEALAMLSLLKDKHESVPYWPTFSSLLGSHILAGQGKVEKARVWIAEAESLAPNHPRLAKGTRSAVFYPVELAEGNHEKAASYLVEDCGNNRESSLGAEQAIKAGILFSLAGKHSEAAAVWKRALELFPEKRINFYGGLARSLMAGKMDSAHEMPYPAEKRSEMFYLLGLLFESKGETTRAQDFFQKSVREDPLRNWPAVMAERKAEKP